MQLKADALSLALREDLGHLLVSDGLDLWPPDARPKQVAAHQLASALLKKFVDHTDAEADAVAQGKFLESNQLCKEWAYKPETVRDEVLLGSFKAVLTGFFSSDDGSGDIIGSFANILSNARSGPGSSIGATGESFYTKYFSSRLTGISSAMYQVYMNYHEQDPLWAAAEQARATRYGDYVVVEEGRLAFVPKRTDCSRTIVIESSLATFYQLGIETIFRNRLKSFFGIDLSTQSVLNRELAREGSLKDHNITIDLTEASNSVSERMLRWALPRNILQWLDFCRTRYVKLPSGERVELAMYSSMGNGYTFPLETIVFSAVVAAAASFREIHLPKPWITDSSNAWGVFGDDIICPKRLTMDVLRLLDLLGFRVNRDKSFVEGPFRESCGADYYEGSNVRGVYCKSLSTPQDLYTLINNLNEWTARTGIVLSNTVRLLLSGVRVYPVPPWENEDAGVRMPLHLATSKRSKRYQGSWLYTRWVPKPPKISFGDGTVILPNLLRKKYGSVGYNSDALLLCFLKGVIRGCSNKSASDHGRLGEISVRHNRNFYEPKPAVAPNWDYPTPKVERVQLIWKQALEASGRVLTREEDYQDDNTAPGRHEAGDYLMHWDSACLLNMFL